MRLFRDSPGAVVSAVSRSLRVLPPAAAGSGSGSDSSGGGGVTMKEDGIWRAVAAAGVLSLSFPQPQPVPVPVPVPTAALEILRATVTALLLVSPRPSGGMSTDSDADAGALELIIDDSLLPQQALTQCGEHLLSLVQDLESFSNSDALDDLRALTGVADSVLPYTLAWGSHLAQALMRVGAKNLPIGTGTGTGAGTRPSSSSSPPDFADVEEGVMQLSRRPACVACVSVCEKVVFGSFLTDLADYEAEGTEDGAGSTEASHNASSSLSADTAARASVTHTHTQGPTPASASTLASDDASDETASLNFVNHWLGALGDALVGALVASVVQIKQLSSTGRAQLAVDLDYLTNVISAVGLRVHPLLLHIRTFLAAPMEAEALLAAVQAMPAVKPVATSLKLVDLAVARAMAAGKTL